MFHMIWMAECRKAEFRETFIFKPELLFLRKNHKNDNLVEFLDFYEFTLFMIFKNFHENSHYRNGHFQENRENYIYWLVLKNPRILLSYHSCDFPRK